jgi:low affinity Fe/Cu permease
MQALYLPSELLANSTCSKGISYCIRTANHAGIGWSTNCNTLLRTGMSTVAGSAKNPPSAQEWFRRFAHRASDAVGSPWAFLAGALVIVVWACFGPAFHYSDTWQLIVNTGTTIITFLMVFLIQHAQNRDSRVIQMKLDELIRAMREARTELIQMETLSDEELENMQSQFREERDRAVRRLERLESARRSRRASQSNGA